jgi:CRISPR-associated endonuclease Csn1
MKEARFEILTPRNYDIKGKFKAGKVGDQRLEREFAEPGDRTCYTSCLLRIRLLRGEKLEQWQIYKALHSAIQRRGYDPDIPWKTQSQSKEATEKDGDDEAGTEARMKDFEKQLVAMSPSHPEYQFPCYFDAWKMGLWDPKQPKLLRDRIDCHAESTRNQIIPRKLVENEIRKLVESASKFYPQLKGKADYLLYGPSGIPYASHDSALRQKYGLKQGGVSDWQGVLGQKIPRFDNRIIGKCILIPRLNVCKIRTDENGNIHPQSRLAAEVTFLMKLKNMRLQRLGSESQLSASEIKAIFENPAFEKLSISAAQWKKLVCVPLCSVPLPGHESVESPKISGRSRFCRPALDILKRLILSGLSPTAFYKQEIARVMGNSDPMKGLVKEDLSFLLRMSDTWDGIHIPNQKLDALVRDSKNSDLAIRTLIGSQNDPIVRHRLGLFAERLGKLSDEFGIPDAVALEFVREDFMGLKAKLEYNRFIKERAEQRAKAKREAAEAGATESVAGFKLELLRAQQGVCLYTGAGLVPTALDDYEIDHIVPRSKGGPDAALNFVLTTKAANKDKADRTPYEWLSRTGGWDAFVNRVRARLTTLRHKKAQLLISPEAEKLVEKYTALAETSWISKLAQAILDLQFGWKNGNDAQGRKRVIVVSGGLTGRIRRKYQLNHILNPDAKTEEEAEKKNRDDNRHHALDAMVISFLPSWARDSKKTGFFQFPNGISKELFAKEIESVIPENICFQKATLAETIYGARNQPGGSIIVQRVKVLSLAQKSIAPGKTRYDLDYARKQIQSIRDGYIRETLAKFVDSGPSEQAWIKFCEQFCLKQKNGKDGSHVKFVTVNVGDADEYKDLSKDQTGAFRRGGKGHKGQFIYVDDSGKARVRPVYAFESNNKVRLELLQRMAPTAIKGFYQSGCLVVLEKPVPHPKTPLSSGKYSLNTIRGDGYVVLTNASGQVSQPIGLNKLLPAGFRRLG